MKMRRMFLRDGVSGLIFDIAIYIIMVFMLIITLYPFLNMIAVSFNDALDSLLGGIRLWPRRFTLYNYENIFKNANIFQATITSVARTVVGALLNLCACMMLAYSLSRKEFFCRYIFLKVLVFTMYFSGGLIPTYLLLRQLGMVGTFWVYVIPGMVSAWNIIILRSYIENSISDTIIESARIDGASEFTTLFKIIFPLSLPVIATVMLWNVVGQWNNWFDVMLYNSNKPNLSTLQYELQKVLMQTVQTQSVYNSAALGAEMSAKRQTTTAQATRAAMTIVASLPILMAYPFLQKYFIHGLTLGGVKE